MNRPFFSSPYSLQCHWVLGLEKQFNIDQSNNFFLCSFAFVGVESNEEMQKASSLLNGKEIDGRILRVRPADQFKKNQKQDNKLK